MDSRWTWWIDRLQGVLVVSLALVIATGGVVHRSAFGKIDLRPADGAAIALFGLCVVRRRISGEWFAPVLLRLGRHVADRISRHPVRSLLALIFIDVLGMTWIKMRQFDSFHANAYDLGYVDQAIWCTGRCGADFQDSFLASSLALNGTYLGEHFAPILALFSPLYAVWDSTYLLFFVQCAILGSGAILLYRLARLYELDPFPSWVLSLCYLLYQPLRAANLFDLREDDLFIPLLLGLFCAAKAGRRAWLWPLSVLLFGVKENGSILVALFAAVAFATPDATREPRRARPHLIALLAISVAVFVLVNQVLTPFFSGGAARTRFAFRMGVEAAQSGGLLQFLLTHPAGFLHVVSEHLFQTSILRYFLVVFTPFLLALRDSPVAILAAVLLFVLNVAIGVPSVGFHYECALIPFAFLALVRTLRRRRPALGMVVLSFLLFWGKSPIHFLRLYQPNEHHRMVREELAKLPPQASIAAQSCLQPHLAHREEALMLEGSPTSEYVLADLSDGMTRFGTPRLAEDVAALDPVRYEKIVERDGLVVFRRR